jgi:hypothetical protein
VRYGALVRSWSMEMSLLGKAAMLLSFDVVEDAIPEHDDWHTHEHLPERLSIPGFVRGTRWVSLDGKPRYFVMYEVDQLATLQSEAYLERLNNPSPWTSKMLPNYRGMTRGLCSVSCSLGAGMGQIGLLIRFKPEPGLESSLRTWLINDTLPQLPSRRGLGSAHLFEGALTPHMTKEQRIRGADTGVDWALFVTGYGEHALAGLMQSDLSRTQIEEHGGTEVSVAMYRMHYMLTDRDVYA